MTFDSSSFSVYCPQLAIDSLGQIKVWPRADLHFGGELSPNGCGGYVRVRAPSVLTKRQNVEYHPTLTIDSVLLHTMTKFPVRRGKNERNVG